MRILDRGTTKSNSRSGSGGASAFAKSLLATLLFFCGLAVGVRIATSGLLDAFTMRLVTAPRMIQATLAHPVKRLTLDVSHINLQRLAFERQLAVQRGVLVQSPDAWVSAQIQFDGETHNARIRLKGDLVDQFSGQHWAFRVQLKGEDALLGMKIFSLHQPSARNYVYEWVLHQMMKDEGLIGLRYEFVELALNGKSLGIYAVEEHFEKRLVESNGRPEGPIVAIEEDADIESIRHFGWPTKRRVGYDGQPVQIYREKRTLSDDRLRGMFFTAHDLLASFLDGSRPASDVFAIDDFARYFAILDLTNGRHAAKYGNLKLYYNPIASRLEPICYDAEFVGQSMRPPYGGGFLAESWQSSGDWLEFSSRLFVEPAFFAKYVSELERLATKDHLDAFFERHGPEIRDLSGIIRRSTPTFDFSSTTFYERAEQIQRLLSRPASLTAFPGDSGGAGLGLDVMNVSPLHLQIDGYRRGKEPVRLATPVVVPAAAPGEQPRFQRVTLPPAPLAQAPPPGAPAGNLVTELEFRVVGSAHEQSLVVADLPRLIDAKRLEDLSRAPANPESFSFISSDGSGGFRIDAGAWTIDHPLVLPADASLEVAAGAALSLAPGASILARGALRFRGSPDAGIRLEGSGDGSGLLLLSAKAPSIFEHVTFANLSAPLISGTVLNGAVTIYDSEVEFRHSAFIDSRSEDSLNVVRSSFALLDSSFERSRGDAFDSDFSVGRIERTRFLDQANDAIDISGTSLSVDRIEVRRSGDKGISAGEQSSLTGTSALIRDCEIGLAAKDRSEIRLSRVNLLGCRLGFAVFQKKPEFGPAVIEVKGAQSNSVEQLYLLETPSRLELNEAPMPANCDRVEPLLYGARFGKATTRQ